MVLAMREIIQEIGFNLIDIFKRRNEVQSTQLKEELQIWGVWTKHHYSPIIIIRDMKPPTCLDFLLLDESSKTYL